MKAKIKGNNIKSHTLGCLPSSAVVNVVARRQTTQPYPIGPLGTSAFKIICLNQLSKGLNLRPFTSATLHTCFTFFFWSSPYLGFSGGRLSFFSSTCTTALEGDLVSG